MPRKISDEDIDAAITAYQSGEEVTAIRARCSSLHYWLKVYGIPPRKRPMPGKIKDAITAYQRGEKVTSICEDHSVHSTVLYDWINRQGVAKRGRYENYRKHEPLPHVKAAVEAYKNNAIKVSDIVAKHRVSHSVLDHWLDRLEVPRTRRVPKFNPAITTAIEAYKRGERLKTIRCRFGVPTGTLYFWLDRFEVPRRSRGGKFRKPGRPKLSQFILDCDWCHEPLSEWQVKRRRKYCCPECEALGIEAANQVKLKLCQAPGCTAFAMEDTDYCGWPCFQTAMERRFG